MLEILQTDKKPQSTLEALEAIKAREAQNAVIIEPPSLPSLDTMSREELVGLIKLVGGAIWGYALMGREEKAEAARLKLYNDGMTSKEANRYIPALDKWFDREFGKAAQSIALDVKDERMNKLPIDKLLRLASMLDEPLVIAPMPTKD